MENQNEQGEIILAQREVQRDLRENLEASVRDSILVIAN